MPTVMVRMLNDFVADVRLEVDVEAPEIIAQTVPILQVRHEYSRAKANQRRAREQAEGQDGRYDVVVEVAHESGSLSANLVMSD
eukprot:18051-Eustigmatos_ZCMA.PRE.1